MKYKVSNKELKERQAFPLEEKILWAIYKYIDYVEVYGLENVFISYSGGKDSDVVCDIIDRLHAGEFEGMLHPLYQFLYARFIKGNPAPEKVFCNTGLEWPEIVKHVKSRYPNATILKPKMGFTKFISTQGVAVGSKKIATTIRRLKSYIENPSPKNEATKNLYLTGIKRDGSVGNSKIPDRWLKLLDAPFNVTEKCCDVFKKDPIHEFTKSNGKKAIIGTTAAGSDNRTVSYMMTGCISWEKGKEKCRPISIFLEEDIWAYSRKYNFEFCEVYYNRVKDVVQLDGSIKKENLEAESKTGCTFCMFGLHLEPKDRANRIQRIAISNPKYYDIIINKCGLGEVLGWLKIPYKPFKNKCQQYSLLDKLKDL